MRLLTVIPIQRGVFKEKLTYFTTREVEVGALVMAPVLSRLTPSLVIKSESVSDAKTELRRASFAIKKISKVLSPHFFLPELVEACNELADYYLTTPGQIISTLLPVAVFESSFNHPEPLLYPSVGQKDNLRQENLVLQDTDQARLSQYKSLIREAFARNQSVFLCLPTTSDISKALASIEKGIAPYTITLHSKLPAKKIGLGWQQALESKHPVLVIGTPAFLALPRADIKTIIIDNETNAAYHHDLRRPYFDWRHFARVYARHRRARLIVGDIALSSEVIYQTQRGEYLPQAPLKYRFFTEARSALIDSSHPHGKPKERFQALGSELRDLIADRRQNNERILIITGRRGLSPTTICNDCEAVVRCRRCQSPLVAHKDSTKKEGEGGFFLCHRCGSKVEVEDTCPQCGSWRLALLGIGREKISAELKEHFPEAKLLELDSDVTSTAKKAAETAQKFLNSGGNILVGTEMALYYIGESVENVIFVGIDSLFTVPDYQIDEKIFAMLLRGKLLATKNFIIQTRNGGEPIFDYVLKGNLLDFYREELAERKNFAYPPFTLLIKVSGPTTEKVKASLKEIATLFPDLAPVVYNGSGGSDKPKLTNLLLKLEPGSWPEPKLLEHLKSLPPSFNIEINPQSIF